MELQRERRAASQAARKARDMPTGRPGKLERSDKARRPPDAESGEPVPTIAETLDVSRATLYRYLAEEA